MSRRSSVSTPLTTVLNRQDLKANNVPSTKKMSNNSSSFLTKMLLLALISCSLLPTVSAQGSTIVFAVNTGDGLVYFLLIFFFGVVFMTPVFRWVYEKYLSVMVEQAGKEIAKVSKRLSDRMSDVGRKVSQSVR